MLLERQERGGFTPEEQWERELGSQSFPRVIEQGEDRGAAWQSAQLEDESCALVQPDNRKHRRCADGGGDL
jgi:hypothetical protein